MDADDSYTRHMRRRRWLVLGLAILLDTAMAAYYALAGVPPLRNAVGWLLGLTGVFALVTFAFGIVQRFQIRTRSEMAEREQTEAALQARTAQLAALRQVGLEIISELDLDAVLHSIVSRAVELLEGVSGGIYLYRRELDALEWMVAIGPYAEPLGTILRRGEGLSGKVWETGEPLIVDDYSTWEGRARVFEGAPFTAVLGIPVRHGDELLGVINVLADPPHTFAEADAELLGLFAAQAAIAIRNARLYADTHRQSERLAQALAASELLHHGLRVDQVLEQIARGVVKVGFQAAAITVADRGADTMSVRAVAGIEGADRDKILGAPRRWADFDPLLQERFRISGSYLVCHGEFDWDAHYKGSYVDVVSPDNVRGPGYWHPEDALLVPLRDTQGKPIGMISVDAPVDGLLPDLSAIWTLEAFANQAAVAIENAYLYEEAQQEIAERKQVEEALRRSEERYRSLFDNVPVGLYRTQPDGKILDANPALLQMLAYPNLESLLAVSASEIHADPERRSLESEMLQRDGLVRDFEIWLRRRDGNVIWAQDNARAVHDAQGNLLYYEGSMEDITARKLAEDERERLITELQAALIEVRTLSGLLPICASCKKVRDDQGYWRQVEEYFQVHSGAEFTHSICPDCMQKLYPDLFTD